MNRCICGVCRIAWRQASTRRRNSAPSPARRPSYQAAASSMSRSASGSRIRSLTIPAAKPFLDFFPGAGSAGVLQVGGIPAREFLLLPVRHGDALRRGRETVPEGFDELEFFFRAQVEEGREVG